MIIMCSPEIVSAFVHKENKLQLLMTVSSLFAFLIVPFLIYLITLIFKLNASQTLAVSSPIVAMYFVGNAEHYDWVLWNCFINVIVAIPILFASFYLIPKLADKNFRLFNRRVFGVKGRVQ